MFCCFCSMAIAHCPFHMNPKPSQGVQNSKCLASSPHWVTAWASFLPKCHSGVGTGVRKLSVYSHVFSWCRKDEVMAYGQIANTANNEPHIIKHWFTFFYRNETALTLSAHDCPVRCIMYGKLKLKILCDHISLWRRVIRGIITILTKCVLHSVWWWLKY